MKNKKGFTLIELLSVLTLLGIIMIIAVPNILSIVDKNKKETMLSDAKRLMKATQYEASFNESLLPTPETPTKIHTLADLWELGVKDLEIDPDDGTYDINASYVKIVLSENNYFYYIKLCGSNRYINEVKEEELTSNKIVLEGMCP